MLVRLLVNIVERAQEDAQELWQQGEGINAGKFLAGLSSGILRDRMPQTSIQMGPNSGLVRTPMKYYGGLNKGVFEVFETVAVLGICNHHIISTSSGSRSALGCLEPPGSDVEAISYYQCHLEVCFRKL